MGTYASMGNERKGLIVERDGLKSDIGKRRELKSRSARQKREGAKLRRTLATLD